MRPLDYVRILRRRWWIIVIGALIGGLLAFLTQPSDASVAQQTAPLVRYRATSFILANSDSVARTSSTPISWDRLALYTIRGEVARKAVASLGGSAVGDVVQAQSQSDSSSSSTGNDSASRKKAKAGDASTINFRKGKGTLRVFAPQGIVDVAAVPDPSINGLSIVVTGGAQQAPKAADAFAAELIKFLDGKAVKAYQQQKADLTGQISDLVVADQSIDAQIATSAANPPLVQSLQQRKVNNAQKIEGIQADLVQLERQGPAIGQYAPLDSAQNGQLQQVRTPGGSAISSSQRLILGGAIGALLGLVLLIIMELLGARIRDVQGTEGAARMPVIAEIPVVKMNRADRFVVATSADPASLTAEAYRSLRTSLLAMWQRHPKNTPLPAARNGNGNGATNGNVNGSGNGAPHGRPLKTLLVTSPGPAEGKSISVVNLAAAFAETGMSVIVIDSDFRRPTQCRYLDRPKSPNLADLDIACSPEDLEAVLQDTEVPGVRLAASAPTKSDPGHAIAVAKSAVRAAQDLADIVIVDSPPLLLANDASDLALGVDATILLARAGWTRRSGVVASADLLRRLEAPVIGIAIVGAEHGVRAGYYGYYGYYGYGYGYAHPGEVSIVHRLMPWKAGRKASSRPSPQRQQSQAGRSGSASSAPTSVADPDDPWV